MSEISSSNKKRLVSNSFFLTVRMLLLMIISFYTTRVVLEKLGFVDYGIYSVVGGLSSMFIFFRSSLSNVTQRYLNIELGKGDIDGARCVFCQHQTMYIVIAVVIVVLLETIGLWFLYKKLVVPSERLSAAFWVFQFMVVSLMVTLLSVVYNSAIVAHEDFKIYAYISIFEGISKLIIALILGITHYDRLITYGLLLVLLSVMVQFFYMKFCRRHYQECRFQFNFNKQSIKETFGMIGWNTAGTAVHAINTQGLDILLNLYFGPVVNAAKSISNRVNQAVMIFTDSFYTSVRPQLTKSYAAEDFEFMMRLFYQSSKYGFFILWVVSLPTMLCIDTLLSLWLGQVPAHTTSFSILVIVYSLVNVLNDPIWSLALSIGKLKWYIIIGSSVFLMSFPISYVFLCLGYAAESVFIANAAVRAVYILVVIHIIRQYVPISRKNYLKTVVLPIVVVVLLSGGLSFAFKSFISAFRFQWLFVASFSVSIAAICIWSIGLQDNERKFFVKLIREKVFKKRQN